MSNRRIGYVQLHNEITFLMHFLTQKYVLRKKVRSLSSSFMHLLTFFACTPLPGTAVQYCMGGPYTSVRTRRRRSIPQSFSYCTKMNPSRQEKCSWSRICFCHLALKLHFPTFFSRHLTSVVVKVFPT